MDSVGRAALEGAALGALAGGVGAAVGAAGLSGAAAFAVSEGADFIGGFLYDIGVNGLSREEALINGLMGIGFGGAIGLLGRGLSRAARNVNLPLPRQLRRQCASFSADTLIATPDGDKPISEIEVGDVILAYSEATEEVDIYHVSATHNQRHDSTLDLTIDGETLHTTDEHPFYVIRDDQEQWVQAKHLHIGDRVVSGLGEIGTVEDIIIIDQPQTMYNLTVSLVATYLVGDGQWVVHNVQCYRFANKDDPDDMLPSMMRRNPNLSWYDTNMFLRDLTGSDEFDVLWKQLQDISLYQTMDDWIRYHASGGHMKRPVPTPFISVTTDLQGALNTTDTEFLQPMIYGGKVKEIAILDIPHDRLIRPTQALSIAEGEALFLGDDIAQYIETWMPNMFIGRLR